MIGFLPSRLLIPAKPVLGWIPSHGSSRALLGSRLPVNDLYLVLTSTLLCDRQPRTQLNQILPCTETLISFASDDCHIERGFIVEPMEQSV